jgi:hypothetical protein
VRRKFLKVSEKARKEWEVYKGRTKKRAIRKGFDLIHSEAYLSLRYAPSHKVLDWFLEKRKVIRHEKRKGKKRWEVVNSPFSFTYEDARCRGLSDQQFSGALKELHALGFIDVVEHGAGMMKSYTQFALSERWRAYGPPDFKKIEFPGSNYIGYRRPKGSKNNDEKSSLVNNEMSPLRISESNRKAEFSPQKSARTNDENS